MELDRRHGRIGVLINGVTAIYMRVGGCILGEVS